MEKFPDIEYVALDLSLNRLTLLAQQYPRAGIHYGDFFSYTGKKHDVVMALEVTMHIPPTLVDSFCKKMIASASKAVITIDYYPAQERDVQLLEFNFLHDYPKLLQRPKRTQVNYVQSMFVKKLRG